MCPIVSDTSSPGLSWVKTVVVVVVGVRTLSYECQNLAQCLLMIYSISADATM